MSPNEPFDAIESPDPAPRRPRRGWLVSAAVVGVAVALALVGAGIVGIAGGGADGSGGTVSFAAASDSPSASTDEERSTKARKHARTFARDRWRHGPRRGPMHGGPAFGGLHGTFVVPDGDGFKTVVMQRGKASDISDSAMTVTSDDGFATTYRLTSETAVGAPRDGVTTIKDGDQVVVLADKSGDVTTARHVVDLDRFERGALGGPPAPPGTSEGTSYGA